MNKKILVLLLAILVFLIGGKIFLSKGEKKAFKLYAPGKEEIVNYRKYGEFVGVGTKDYNYKIIDQRGLIEAVGEGIYPDTSSVLKDPQFKRLKKEGRLEGSHWEFISGDDLQANFYKWATAAEERGVKLFYTAFALERAGLIKEAIKAYYAVVVHFPRSVSWTYWKTPFYIAQTAIDRIDFLTRKYPKIGMRLEGARVKIINGFDNDISNDIVITNPGRIIKVKPTRFRGYPESKIRNQKLKDLKIKRRVTTGRIELLQYDNGHWQLFVDNKPYPIKAVAYSPNKVGQSPDEGTLEDWMQADYNQNGKIDAPYDAWVDKNRNNVQDKGEEAVGDFQLMKEMGVNTIRVYDHVLTRNKELLRDLYENYGIMTLMGDFLGAYAIGSGASWYRGTDYNNPEQRRKMLERVKKMVMEYKDEPFILMWVLGNENNYGVANNAKKFPVAYYQFVERIAKWIKSVDPNHPVAVSNGDLLYLDIFAREAKDVDIFGINAYRGNHGFGRTLWMNVKDETDKPVLITEYGCPAYMEGKSREVAEEAQAEYLKNSWEDIEYNMAGSGMGNALGGVLFEWIDEWWKAYEPYEHDTKGQFYGPFPDGFMYEEWLGITSQGDGKSSPYLRQLRKAYYLHKKIWR